MPNNNLKIQSSIVTACWPGQALPLLVFFSIVLTSAWKKNFWRRSSASFQCYRALQNLSKHKTFLKLTETGELIWIIATIEILISTLWSYQSHWWITLSFLWWIFSFQLGRLPFFYPACLITDQKNIQNSNFRLLVPL